MLIAGIYGAGGYSPANERIFRRLCLLHGVRAGVWYSKTAHSRRKTKSSRRERERYIQEIPHDMAQAGYHNPRYKH